MTKLHAAAEVAQAFLRASYAPPHRDWTISANYWNGCKPVTTSPHAVGSLFWLGINEVAVAAEDLARTDPLGDVIVPAYDATGCFAAYVTEPPLFSVRARELETDAVPGELVFANRHGVAYLASDARQVDTLVIGSSLAGYLRAATKYPRATVVGVDAELGTARLGDLAESVTATIAVIAAPNPYLDEPDPVVAYVRDRALCVIRNG